MVNREHIIELATRIAELRRELHELENEMDTLLGEAKSRAYNEPYGKGLTARVLDFFSNNKASAWSPHEMMGPIGLSKDKINSLRTTLIRLVAEKKIEKAGPGKYCTLKQEKSATATLPIQADFEKEQSNMPRPSAT